MYAFNTLVIKLSMLCLLKLIIVNIVFYLFYPQVEPVFYLRNKINAIQITSVSSIIGNNYSLHNKEYFGISHRIFFLSKYTLK